MKIRLSISYLLVFIFLCLPVVSWAASVTLRWQANSEPDIAGYNLYYGTASRSYGPPMPTGNTTSYTVDNLVEGQTYYFALTALDTSGNESGYSSEISANATSSEPATEDYTLLLSYNSDRSDAVDLSGQTISGDVYIYLNPEAYVSQVVFSIDGQTQNTENYAPYDIGMPFDTTSLSNGSHTISALIRLQDGATKTISAVCSVNNETSTPPPTNSGDLTQVAMWWTAASNRDSSVPVRIYDGSQLLDTKTVDQKVNGGKWNSLGSYAFSSAPRVVIVAQGTDVTVADAVRFIAPDGTTKIVDNGGTGTSASGLWYRSSVSNYYGSVSEYTKSEGSYSFTSSTSTSGDTTTTPPPVDSGDLTQVAMWWTAASNRDSSVPVRIYDGSQLLDTKTVDQKVNGGKWNSLGSYAFSSAPRVVIVAQGTDVTVADAVRFIAPDGTTKIVDNGGTGTSASGLWYRSSVSNYYGSVSEYTKSEGSYSFTSSTSTSGDTTTTPPPVDSGDLTQVAMWWTAASNRDSSVPVRIYDGSQLLDTKTVDQKVNGGKWNSLGSYAFSSAPRVVIVAQGTDVTVADAVRFIAPDGTTKIVDNGRNGTSSTGSWSSSGVSNYYGSVSVFTKSNGTYTFEAK